MPESAASRMPYTQPTRTRIDHALPPSQPNPSDTTPLAAAMVIADRARPQRSDSQPPSHTPTVPRPAINAAHLPPSAADSTWLNPEPISTVARNAASQPRDTYSSHEWPL